MSRSPSEGSLLRPRSSPSAGFVAIALVCAACAEPAPIPTPPPLDASERAAIERELTRGTWEEGFSNDMSYHRSILRFTPPDRVEHRVGNVPIHAAHPEEGLTSAHGTFRIDDRGAVEYRISGETTRRTFVVAPSPHGRDTWVSTGYRGDGRSFRHETAVRAGSNEWEVATELAFSDRLDRLDDATCRMRVRVRARVLRDGESQRDTLELDRPCTVDRSGAIHRIVMRGFEDVEPVQVGAELSNWLHREGLDRYEGPIEDVLRAGFQPVLCFDPRRPNELFHAYVAGRTRGEAP